MTLVHNILKQMPALGQPQRKFLATLFVTILGLRGRVNVRNLSRSCAYSERTIARQFRAPFDWPDLPQRVLMTALDPHRRSRKTRGSTSTRSNCVRIGIACRRASAITVWMATMRRRNI